jgi:hypothetical protein
MNKTDYNNFMAVVERMEYAKNRLTADEMRELKGLLMPEETRIVKADHGENLWYLISPDHQGCLHTFYNTHTSATNRR